MDHLFLMFEISAAKQSVKEQEGRIQRVLDNQPDQDPHLHWANTIAWEQSILERRKQQLKNLEYKLNES